MPRRMLIAAACVLAFAAGATAPAAFSYVRQTMGTERLDPKAASQAERQTLSDLVTWGYGDGYTLDAQPNKPDYYDRAESTLFASRGRAPWLQWRLIDELGKSSDPRHACALVLYARSTQDERLRRTALAAAESISGRVRSDLPQHHPPDHRESLPR